MKQWRFVLTCFSLLFAGASIADELTPEKVADIKSLLTENGAIELTKKDFIQAMGAVDLLKTCAECPPNSKEVLTRVSADVISQKISAPGGLAEQLIVVYANHFTHEDVKVWLTFLRTPTGRKVISQQPVLWNEIAPISSAWIRSVIPEINQRTFKELGVAR
jgi:uncharacterized protein